MAPLTILLGCDTFTPNVNGAARFAERLAAGLVQRGHDVHIVAPSTGFGKSGTFTEVVEGQPMTVHRWPSLRWLPHEWVRFTWPQVAAVLAGRTLDRVRPDAVHVNSHIMGGRYLIRAATKRDIRLVATNHVMSENISEHTTLPEFLNRAFIKWAWWDVDRLLRQARWVTTPTRRAADYLEQHTSLRDVLAISCGIDASRYSPDFSPRPTNRMLFVGRLVEEKRVEVLIRALTMLPKDLAVELDIAGSGDHRRHLEQFAAELGVADRVVFHGAVTDDQLRELYSHASLFGIASIAELQSIATLEAMSSGLPILAADAMALPHLVQDGVNGYLFTPDDARAAAERIETILRLPQDARVAMQRASVDGVRVHSLDHTLDVFESLYRGELDRSDQD